MKNKVQALMKIKNKKTFSLPEKSKNYHFE